MKKLSKSNAVWNISIKNHFFKFDKVLLRAFVIFENIFMFCQHVGEKFKTTSLWFPIRLLRWGCIFWLCACSFIATRLIIMIFFSVYGLIFIKFSTRSVVSLIEYVVYGVVDDGVLLRFPFDFNQFQFILSVRV